MTGIIYGSNATLLYGKLLIVEEVCHLKMGGSGQKYLKSGDVGYLIA
ncbi:MAG: hypothetical protein IPI04_08990 [Ignavibacteria bacterium]|nr:hypothetical protein [Ignavibacteria bacterium]